MNMTLQVMLCFSRDTEILSLVLHSSSNLIHAILRGMPVAVESTVVYPPSGIIPFHGFTMYGRCDPLSQLFFSDVPVLTAPLSPLATALCYVYDDPVALYYTFRAFYMRYWFRLHEVSSHEQGILSLCLLFDRLVQTHEPQLWIHFKKINIQPWVQL